MAAGGRAVSAAFSNPSLFESKTVTVVRAAVEAATAAGNQQAEFDVLNDRSR